MDLYPILSSSTWTALGIGAASWLYVCVMWALRPGFSTGESSHTRVNFIQWLVAALGGSVPPMRYEIHVLTDYRPVLWRGKVHVIKLAAAGLLLFLNSVLSPRVNLFEVNPFSTCTKLPEKLAIAQSHAMKTLLFKEERARVAGAEACRMAANAALSDRKIGSCAAWVENLTVPPQCRQTEHPVLNIQNITHQLQVLWSSSNDALLQAATESVAVPVFESLPTTELTLNAADAVFLHIFSRANATAYKNLIRTAGKNVLLKVGCNSTIYRQPLMFGGVMTTCELTEEFSQVNVIYGRSVRQVLGLVRAELTRAIDILQCEHKHRIARSLTTSAQWLKYSAYIVRLARASGRRSVLREMMEALRAIERDHVLSNQDYKQLSHNSEDLDSCDDVEQSARLALTERVRRLQEDIFHFESRSKRNDLYSSNLTYIKTRTLDENDNVEVNPWFTIDLIEAADLIEELVAQFNILSECYIVYLCLTLFITTPLRITGSRRSVRLRRQCFVIPKFYFISAVLICIWFWDFLKPQLMEFQIGQYFASIKSDPCSVHRSYIDGVQDIASQVCAEFDALQTLRRNIGIDLLKDLSTKAAKNVEGACDTIKITSSYTLNKIHGCANAAAYTPAVKHCRETITRAAHVAGAPTRKSSSWLFTMGIVSWLGLRMVVSHFGLKLLGFVDPLSLHDGKIELAIGAMPPDTTRLTRHLRASQACSLALWLTLTVLVLAASFAATN